MKEFVIGIDQGTTGTFVGIMDSEGVIVHHAYRSHRQFYPAKGHVEHDPDEIWQNVRDLLNHVVKESGVGSEAIAGIGIANQGESVVLWDSVSGKPLSRIIVWQDTRTQDYMNAVLSDSIAAREIIDRTGLRPDAYFSASKIRWLIDNTPEAARLLKAGQLRCGTLDTWLIWLLTGGRSYLTDVSTASRTLLLNVHSLDWDSWLLDLFGIPVDLLAEIVETTGDFGSVVNAELSFDNVPILASLVDQPAAMLGQGCYLPGTIKATYGTGCFINLNTGTEAIVSARGLLTLVAWQRAGIPTYGLDGGVFSAGASLNWLRDQVGLIKDVSDIDSICRTTQDTAGTMWIPAQVGLGAPYWDRDVRGGWLGLDLSTDRSQLIMAVLEGIALRVAQIIQSMAADSQTKIPRLRADGGLTRSETLMQIQADLIGIPVETLADQEATVRGACSLAARQAGIWKSDDMIASQVKVARVFEPSRTAEYREERLDTFDKAVAVLRSWKNEKPGSLKNV